MTKPDYHAAVAAKLGERLALKLAAMARVVPDGALGAGLRGLLDASLPQAPLPGSKGNRAQRRAAQRKPAP